MDKKNIQINEVEVLAKKIRTLDKESLIKVFGLTIQEQQKQIENMKPKVDFYDKVTPTPKLLNLSKCAKILNFKNIGRNNLFSVLRDIDVLQPNNEPYQKYVDQNYFCIKEKEIEVQPGFIKIYAQTFVTQKGLDFIRRKLEQNGFEYNEDNNK